MPNQKKGKKGTLTIMVRQAKDLPPMDANGLANAAVKCYLLPDRSSRGKRKTDVIKNNLKPVWEEQFTYEVGHEELSRERVLEVSVWEYDKQGNTFIGGLRLGLAPGQKPKEWMDSVGDELIHWEEMLDHPGEWVEHWHALRPTLNPRPVRPPSASPSPVSYSPSPTHWPRPPSTPPRRPQQVDQPPLEDEFQKVSVPSQQMPPPATTPPIKPPRETDKKELAEPQPEPELNGQSSSKSSPRESPGAAVAVSTVAVRVDGSQESLESREDLPTPQRVSCNSQPNL